MTAKHKPRQQHVPPPPPPQPPTSPSQCLRVSRPLSPGEAAPNQRCDLFIRRLQTRQRRRHERPRLVIANCLICLSRAPLAPHPSTANTATHTPSSCSAPPPLPLSPLTAAPTGEELVCVKLRANSGAHHRSRCVCVSVCVWVRGCGNVPPLCSPSPFHPRLSPSSPFIPSKNAACRRSHQSAEEDKDQRRRKTRL